MLTATHLSKRYHTFRAIEAVSDICLSLPVGQTLAIVGRSGSGKSTLLAMLGGLLRPTGGEVAIDGVNVWALSDRALADFRNRSVGFVFQLPSLLPNLRAVDNVALPTLISRSRAPAVAYGQANELLRAVGLGDRGEAYPGELSGGELRRIAIARALIHSPPLVLADEPTGDLDGQTEADILDLLRHLQRRGNFTMIVVTHNPAVARAADVTIEMAGGRVASTRRGAAPTPLEPPRLGADVAASRVPVPASAETREAELTEAPVRLGEGFTRLLTTMGCWIALVVIAGVLINAVVAGYQQHVLNKKRAAALALAELAMSGLRADVKSVAFGSGESYEAEIYLRNVTGGAPLYVMSPSVRGFIQVGGRWQEIPLRPADGGQEGTVFKLTGEHIFRYVFDPNTPDYEQLIPYYMHVRFTNTMLVSRSERPAAPADIVERSDDYYVYLKPQQADDTVILRVLKFDGAPPVWIPMPPH